MTSPLVAVAPSCYRFSLRVAEGLWLVESNDAQFARTLSGAASARAKNVPHELWLRVQVVDGDPALEPTHFRGMGHLVICRYGANVFVFDLHRKQVNALLSNSAAHHREFWRTCWIPLILGVMASSIGVLPVHSACVVKGGRGVLVAGESMAGKSTLCVALAKNGYELLSDDWTYVRPSGAGFLCCGLQVPVKLLPDAIGHYPELARHAPARTANGEIAYEVSGSSLGVRYATACLPEAVIFLERTASETTSFRPASRSFVEQYLANSVERLPPELQEAEKTRRSAIVKLGELPAWTFRYSGSPQQGARSLVEFLAKEIPS